MMKNLVSLFLTCRISGTFFNIALIAGLIKGNQWVFINPSGPCLPSSSSFFFASLKEAWRAFANSKSSVSSCRDARTTNLQQSCLKEPILPLARHDGSLQCSTHRGLVAGPNKDLRRSSGMPPGRQASAGAECAA